MSRILAAVLLALPLCQAQPPSSVLHVIIVGLEHGHASGFLSGGALAPAGGLMHRSDASLVGVVEADDQLFDTYAHHYNWPPSLHFHSISEAVARVHPDAALVFTSTRAHRKVVEECAALGIHVMMEKPLAVSFEEARAMEAAASKGHIHVLVDYETTWYPSLAYIVRSAVSQNALGPIIKTVFRDGHSGPVKIHVQPEFLKWLTDPLENGAGALYDFGCYGADIMTSLMNGEVPNSVTAITKHLQPDVYPKVDDEADIILNYAHAVAVLQASWSWPFNVKQMDVYGTTGFIKAIDSSHMEERRKDDPAHSTVVADPLNSPYDDPLHYIAAIIRGQLSEGNDPSSLKTNITASEILDAARESAQRNASVTLPLHR